jgi:arsenate reductase-like glutaredoxin family protein
MKNLVNVKGQAYKKLRPDLSVMSDGEIIKLIRDNPLLMIRPLLTDGITLVTGFKEDEYQELIGASSR